MAVDPSFYLGPRLPRVRLSSWQEVVAAAAAGVLDETQWVELKEAIPATSKPANLELARDLASLSVDGGVLVVGIADAGAAAGDVVGVALTGLQSRIDQVATARVTPPLSVTVDLVEKPGEPSEGVVIVTVPASEGAPHMVDGRYWGRGATGKRVLGDDEVRRLMADRRRRSAGFQDRLRALPAQLDPFGHRSRGRMYLLLEPAAAAREPLSDLVGNQHPLHVMVAATKFRPTWSPSLHSLNHAVPHPDGLAASSLPTGGDPDDFNFLSIVMADDGTLRVTAPAARPFGHGADAPGVPEVVSPGQLLEIVHCCALLASHLALTYSGFRGAWTAGVFVDHLRGLLPTQAYSDVGSRSSPYPSDDYAKVTATTTAELEQQPAVVVERLAKGLLRGLGVADRFLPYTDPAELPLRTR